MLEFLKNHKGTIIVFFILLCQLSVSTIQMIRYDVDNYCCRHMSDDCERFFEGLGINTYQIRGVNYEGETEKGQDYSAHRWLLLDFGIVCIPFETTVLAFGFDPIFWKGYERLEISEGHIKHGRVYGEMEWKTWF